ncbi:SDR family oxidoreductase [Synechococcus sp. PCC 6312]|uniref:SDR family oxidoreductase n=1 Tax=Synechococcus sp. (strain ATCC 27167 / PCC 6312) TaxID=195253 RepID=UPI00029ED332|nr:SDR family oxidoreductase [Synechococcus sp. PCC 6312]AFY60999.1 short-chain alcohol dehydrogenase [Synechococcus sp. PCC 6312]
MNILTTSQQEGLAGKVIAITGASSGIGEAAARFLATKGSKVVLGARRIENLKTIADEIQSAGGEVCFTSLDVTQKEQLEKFIQFAQVQFGRVDVLVSNAGLMPLSLLEQLKVEEWDRMIDVNLKGVLYGIAAALPVFKAQNSGHFVNITSIADRWVGPTSTIYSATKHAVRVVSEGLRQEMGNTIRVTIIAPGATESELPNTISDSEMKKTVIEQFRIDLIPAEAIARAIAYAVEQPADVDVNEIVVRPTAQKY